MGTEYESKDKEYVSTDALKTMTLDEYGRASIDIQDAFGNTIISKDEASGTWTESVYEYGAENGEEEDDPDLEQEENDRLLEERTYTFQPDEKKFIVNEDGKTVPNFYITGRDNLPHLVHRHLQLLGNLLGAWLPPVQVEKLA